MKKRRKLLQRLTALVLVASLWWQTDSMRFFCTAYAAETQQMTNDSFVEKESVSMDEQTPVTVLGEVEELRKEDEKHFSMSDGSFMAVSYGMPVHFKDASGNWQDIDNRMVLSEDQMTYQTVTPQSSASFAAALTDGVLFETSYEDTSVTLSLMDMAVADKRIQTENTGLLTYDRTSAADPTVEVENILDTYENEPQTDRKGWTMEDILPENIQDSLLYEEVFSGVDLLYTKYSHNIKEQIVVKEPQTSYRYDFKLTLDNVVAVLNEDGSVSLNQKEDTQKEIYHIPAPFMQDAKGTISYEAGYTLTEVSDGVILTVEADAEWMNDEARKFPIMIDPTIVISAGKESEDVYFSYTAQGEPNVHYTGSSTYIVYESSCAFVISAFSPSPSSS